MPTTIQPQGKKGKTMSPLTQFKKIPILPLLIAPMVVVLAALTALPARAAPPQTCGLTVTGVIDLHNPNQAAQFAEIMSYAKIGDWKAKLSIDQFQLYVVEVTIQPGGWLGWHSHPGLSLVVVKSGTARCSSPPAISFSGKATAATKCTFCWKGKSRSALVILCSRPQGQAC
jgi:hypothetical protein